MVTRPNDCKDCDFVMAAKRNDNKYLITETPYNIVMLNPKLSPFLGRSAVIPKFHTKYYSDLHGESLLSFFRQVDLLKSVLHLAFGAVQTLDVRVKSSTAHVNYDVIPHYEKGVVRFADQEFRSTDYETGIYLRTYRDAPPLADDLIEKIIDAMRNAYARKI